MSLAIAERPVLRERLQESRLPSQIVSCPQELLPAVTLIERFASDLLAKVGMAVNVVKLKLLLPVETYSTGRLWWRQSYVLTEDLRKLDIDVSRFAKTRMSEGMAVSVEELRKHDLEVTQDHAYRAKWYPSKKTIKVSAKVLHEALHLVVFELTNASFNRQIRSISALPKEKQVMEYERLEFGTTQAVRQTLNKIPSCENHYQYTHRHFELHYLYQELRGHVALVAKFVGIQEVKSAWPYAMNTEERAKLAKVIDCHILSLYGTESEKERYETMLVLLTKSLEGNLKKNWDWYRDLYEQITHEESTDVNN